MGPRWNPPGVDTCISAPNHCHHEGNLWRPPQPLPEVPQDKMERTKRAIAEQCLNSRVPGYTGFIPSARAEDVCARTQASVGRSAQAEQMRRREMRAPMSARAVMCGEANVTKRTLGFEGADMPDDHPLGKSRANIMRNHWVPTIPGYGGFIPAKEAESCIGGGMAATCRMAGRAIAERRQQLLEPEQVDKQADLGPHKDGSSTERSRIVNHLRSHCVGKIPGYMGFIPRVHGDSIFGAGAAAVNKMAADFCEDRVLNPSDHGQKCCAPQFPVSRKLRT